MGVQYFPCIPSRGTQEKLYELLQLQSGCYNDVSEQKGDLIEYSEKQGGLTFTPWYFEFQPVNTFLTQTNGILRFFFPLRILFKDITEKIKYLKLLSLPDFSKQILISVCYIFKLKRY